jgi:hypothetical protein
MQSYIPTDVTSLTIELNELKSKFDYTVREGKDFTNLRSIYTHIKELECHIETLQWDSERQSVSHPSSFPIR